MSTWYEHGDHEWMKPEAGHCAYVQPNGSSLNGGKLPKGRELIGFRPRTRAKKRGRRT